jgi:hypothetical protein
MDEGPLLASLDRMEFALDRLERSLEAPGLVARDADLERRHEQLKLSVADAIARIDELLEPDETSDESAP